MNISIPIIFFIPAKFDNVSYNNNVPAQATPTSIIIFDLFQRLFLAKLIYHLVFVT